MSVAWEIWEQLDRRAPAWLIGPAGNGGLLLGAWRGFEMHARAHLIGALPRLLAVQAFSFAPLHKAYERGGQTVTAIPSPPHPSVADGISIIDPARGASLLTAIYQSRGFTTTVTDTDILAAQRQMAARGFFVEPTSSGTGLKNLPAA